jgi:hypothetical protein
MTGSVRAAAEYQSRECTHSDGLLATSNNHNINIGRPRLAARDDSQPTINHLPADGDVFGLEVFVESARRYAVGNAGNPDGFRGGNPAL